MRIPDDINNRRDTSARRRLLSKATVLQLYPYPEPKDIDAALTYAAWRAEERELPLQHA